MTTAAALSDHSGLTTVESTFNQTETMHRLVREIEGGHQTIFARIDHAAAARAAGLELRPTEVVIFGNPRVGTALMQANQTIGIDLPLKILVWTDGQGKTWVSYYGPKALIDRHAIDLPQVAVSMERMLKTLVEHATKTIDPATP